jgi:hypothetical protein
MINVSTPLQIGQDGGPTSPVDACKPHPVNGLNAPTTDPVAAQGRTSHPRASKLNLASTSILNGTQAEEHN